MREHWRAGYRDTKATLEHRDWLEPPPESEGMVIHDIHSARD